MNTCYLVGYPVGHSMSSVMHNAAFRAKSLDYKFENCSVKPEELKSFIDSDLRSPHIRGASVTIPHKVSVIKHIDALEDAAEKIGSVNTIVNDGGKLKGYNTDGNGAVRSLKEAYGDLDGIKAVILGAGGASRSISYRLSSIVGELVILNRTLSTAEDLVEALAQNPGNRARLAASPLDHVNEALENASLLINTTPIGMSPRTGETPIGKEHLRPSMFVFDVVYNPMKTRLLTDAEAAGARTLNGIDMLVYQGAEAFKLWTDEDAPIEIMKNAVKRALEAG